MCVFARKTTEPLASLVKQIDSKIGDNAKLKSFVVFLNQEENAADDVRKFAEGAGIKNVPLTLHQDAGEVPSYEISKDADVTVLMWVDHKVKVNHAFKGELTEENIRKIIADVPQILSK